MDKQRHSREFSQQDNLEIPSHRPVFQPPLPPGPPPDYHMFPVIPFALPQIPPPQLCRFVNTASGCRRGSTCPFIHQFGLISATAPQTITYERKNPCRFFSSSSGCRNGQSCPFAHLPSSNNKPTLHLPKAEPVFTRTLTNPFFALDVECVATGYEAKDRAVARIAVIDEHEEVVFDRFVKPDMEIVSFLTPLTGIVEQDLVAASNLKSVLIDLKKILPPNCTIVGQSISKDIEWLGLQQDIDFKASFDIALLFRVVRRTNSPFAELRFRYFSLRHVTKMLLGIDIQESHHNPVLDALYSMRLFLRYRHLHESDGYLQAVQKTLATCPQQPSFAEQCPFLDGVALSEHSSRSQEDTVL